MTKNDFQALITSAPLILDGATGSNLMLAGMPKGVCTEKWVLEHPEIIIELQKGYAAAGSQILYAPTFSANRLSMRELGMEDSFLDMIPRLVALTREAAAGTCYIAGDITTTGKTDADYEALFEVYKEQITALVDAGVDLLVAETMLGADECMAAVDAAHAVCDLPVMCSMTIESDGSLFFGGNVFDAAASLEAIGVDAVGINCSTGPAQLESVIATLSRTVSVPIIAKPNAGMPVINDKGQAIYNLPPQEFAASMKKLSEAGARILGGCCGTTPEYIKAMVETL